MIVGNNVSQIKSKEVNYIDITKKINIVEAVPNPDIEEEEEDDDGDE